MAIDLSQLSAFGRQCETQGMTFLSHDDLGEIAAAEYPEDYFIGGIVDHEDRRVVLYRGDLARLAVPFDWFRVSGTAAAPKFDDFEVVDTGQTLRFGTCEAASDAVLYAFDDDARERMRERQVEANRSMRG